MKVLNKHQRVIKQPKDEVVGILKTLSTNNDKIWPTENWPAMRFEVGIREAAKGGHGPIRYTVEIYNPKEIIQFRFSKPDGFDGIHKFEVKELSTTETQVKHTIDMRTNPKAAVLWIFVIRPLHDALIEDAFDKLENNFTEDKKITMWSSWVKFLRKQFASRNRKALAKYQK